MHGGTTPLRRFAPQSRPNSLRSGAAFRRLVEQPDIKYELIFRIGDVGKFDAFNYPIFSAEDEMSSSHEKFPDRTADFSKAGEEGGKAIENATDSAASLLSSAKASLHICRQRH